jgi:hypothetical protein
MGRGSRLWYRQGPRQIVDFIYYFRRKVQGKRERGCQGAESSPEPEPAAPYSIGDDREIRL